MNGEWSLKELYSGYDDPRFAEDMAKLDELCARFADLAERPEGEPREIVRSFILLSEEIEALNINLGSYAGLRQAADTSDAESVSVMGRLMAKNSSLAAPDAKLRRYVASLDSLETVIASDPLLEEYSYLLKNIREDDRYMLDPGAEEIISKYSISGSAAWGDMQQYLTSTVEVDYGGEKTNLSDIRNKAYDPDPEVRKSAYEAELKCYEKIKDAVAFSLNSIKLEVLNRCRLKGYASPLDEALHNARMEKRTLDALMEAIDEYLPVFHGYMRAKARLLGHEGGLPWYDLFAPLGGSDRSFTAAEAGDFLTERFAGFDSELSTMVHRAFDEEWIDFYPRAGKAGGAFCSGIYTVKQSRILTNFDGSLSDVVTLAHELGHAFHNHNLYGNRIMNTDYSMPVAETASTFNETLIMKTVIKEEKDPIKRRALIESRLMDACQVICDIYSRYLFETAVFESRDEEFMFPDRLCSIMLDCQKKAYGDGLDENFMHPYMWLCKSHYYSGELSFYNFPYAFGGLLANGLYEKYEKDGAAFVPLYKKFLRATAVMSVEDAGRVAGTELTDPDFWRMSLEGFKRETEEFIALCS
ncbi:MAG: M3 family oligoendopeptidase [Oscillospiraceae bacterium]|nr:M3 family oligoendopeptidase [Oscillospiraceae bacterium]